MIGANFVCIWINSGSAITWCQQWATRRRGSQCLRARSYCRWWMQLCLMKVGTMMSKSGRWVVAFLILTSAQLMAKLPEETQASWAAITTGRLQVCNNAYALLWCLVFVIKNILRLRHSRRPIHWTSLSQRARRRELWAATTTMNTSRIFTSLPTPLSNRSVSSTSFSFISFSSSFVTFS